MKICFLVHSEMSPAQAEKSTYLGSAARELGHEEHFVPIDTLASHNGRISGWLFPPNAHEVDMEKFDCVWLLSFGKREAFLDKIQLLKLLSERTRVINAPEALIYFHSKISLSDPAMTQATGMFYPETHISGDADRLLAIARKGGGDWVIKPPALSFGEHVSMLSFDEIEAKAQLANLCGGGKQYCLLQRFVPQIEQGEKRVLLAGGKVVGQYLRKSKKDFRTNLAQGGEPVACELIDEEKAACERLAKWLLSQGIYFAGIDLCWPYLIEWNVISPGGIGTILRVTGQNIAKNVVKQVLSAPSQKP